VIYLKAVILAGGFATRLRPLSCSRPKTLFPIVNKPLIEWIFERLANNDVDEAILAVNALTQFYVQQQKPNRHGLKIRFSIDPPRMPLGTAGPVKKAEKLIGHEEPFIVLNGDIFADISYRDLVKTHNKSNALATIALCKVEDPCRYGVAELEDGNRIIRFIEKPPKDKAPSNLINAGVYVLSPKVFDYIPAGRAVSVEREVFPKLAEEGKLFGHHVNGVWMDIGKPEEYLETNKIILDSISNTLKHKKPNGFKLNNPVAFDKQVAIGVNSTIGPYAIIGKNVTIGNNVRVSNSVIFPNVHVEDNASIDGAIIGEGVRIGKRVKITYECIIGDHTKVKDGFEISGKVCPGKEVAENILKPKIHC
jgi:mannose-1-phosphate guanylyltransferase